MAGEKMMYFIELPGIPSRCRVFLHPLVDTTYYRLPTITADFPYSYLTAQPYAPVAGVLTGLPARAKVSASST